MLLFLLQSLSLSSTPLHRHSHSANLPKEIKSYKCMIDRILHAERAGPLRFWGGKPQTSQGKGGRLAKLTQGWTGSGQSPPQGAFIRVTSFPCEGGGLAAHLHSSLRVPRISPNKAGDVLPHATDRGMTPFPSVPCVVIGPGQALR